MAIQLKKLTIVLNFKPSLHHTRSSALCKKKWIKYLKRGTKQTAFDKQTLSGQQLFHVWFHSNRKNEKSGCGVSLDFYLATKQVRSICLGPSIAYEFEAVFFFRNLLILIQVLIQTPMIVDGLRRCSNSAKAQRQMKGRNTITFLIVVNLAVYVMETLLIRSYDYQVTTKIIGLMM